jgi:type II secretory pathway pseudopilin PulG
MLHRTSGFTIVELILIIVVMGILASIGIFAWNGVSASSRDRMREQDMRQWSSTFDLYKSRYVTYPVVPVTAAASPSIVCLGTFSATLNRCGQYNNATASYPDSTATSLLSELQKISDRASTNNGPKVGNLFAGPLVYVSKDTDTPPIKLSAEIVNFFELGCPSGMTDVTTTSPYSNLKSGVTNTTKICSLHKELSYSTSS